LCSNFLANLKNLFIIIALISFFSSCKEEESNGISGLFINEFLASNDACCTDENEEYDDWVEIYNKTESPVNIGGMYFTDKPDDDDPYKIPDSIPNKTTIPAGGFLVLWCDKDEEQGVLHLKVKLSADGESVILIDKDGSSVIDSLTFESQTTDVSMGRDPSNFNQWITFATPTPGFPNK